MIPLAMVFDYTNIDWSCSLHLKAVAGSSRWQNGNICCAMVKAQDTWFTRPVQEHTYVFLGARKSRMACRCFGDGQTLSRIISKLENSTLS